MTRPELRELDCFVAVADQLSFSRAARQLNLSQPPLTRHIQSLEAKVGCRLLERNTHAVSLTPQGRLFLEDARAMLSHLDRAVETVRRAGLGEPARLRLAFVGALLDERLVRLMQIFRKDRPDCQIQVVDLPPSAQLKALAERRLEGGFIGAEPDRATKGICFTPWSREPLFLAVSIDDKLAKSPLRSWSQLRDLPWVMVSREAAPAFRRQFSMLVRRHGLSERIVQESDRLPAVLTMVAAGSGVSMVPQSATHLLKEGIQFKKLPAPQPHLVQAFAYREQSDSTALRDFLRLLKSNRL